MTKRAVLYARVSGDDRSKEGRNLAGQLEMCREYAQERDYQVVIELAEDERGASGAEINLPQLTRIRDMAQAGEFDVLVVRELDRLSRNLAKQLIVEQELKKAGVSIEYVLGEYPDTPEGNFQKHVRAAVTEYEREKIRERSTRGRRLKAKAGHVIVHGHPPYGYRLGEVDGKRMLVKHEPEARIVRMVFQWYTVGDGESGPLSLAGINKRLTALGIPTRADIDTRMAKQRERGQWNRTSIRKMLRRETYAGVFHYSKVRKSDAGRVENPRETWIPVAVPAIVPREVWEAAQERLKTNKQNSRRNTKRQYLLRRRVVCASCGAKMHAKTVVPNGKAYSYYICGASCSNSRFDYARKCTQIENFRADHVDTVVWDWIKSFLTDSATLAEGLRAEQEELEEANAPLRNRLVVVDDLLGDNRRQLARLLDLYLSGEFDREMLTERKTRLETTIGALEREREGLAAQLEARTLTDAQVQTIAEFAERVGQKLSLADESFEVRRRLVELLNVQATLAVEDGERVVYARCLLGESVLSVVSTNR